MQAVESGDLYLNTDRLLLAVRPWGWYLTSPNFNELI